MFSSVNIGHELLVNGCIRVNLKEPFKYASGKTGPVYADIRQVISIPLLFENIKEQLVRSIDRVYNGNKLVIAGGESAGIPFATACALDMSMPMVYVRKKPKEYGIASRIVGMDISGQNVALIEDLCNDGYSKLDFIQAIRDAGGTVEHCFTVFNYDQRGIDQLAEVGVELHSLCTWKVVLALPEFDDVGRQIITDYLANR